MRYWLFIMLLGVTLVPGLLRAQEAEPEVLDWPALQSLILEEHPLVRQAGLFAEQGDWLVRGANGFFDPKIYGDWDQKSFDQKNYFRILDAGVKVSLPFGPRLSLGYQWTNGIFLNPERNLPQNGQALIGLEMPLLRGLWFDPGRAGVQQARYESEVLEARQVQLLNDLLFQGVRIYADWVVAENLVTVLESILRVTRNRHNAVVSSFLAGDLPGVDTVESFLQIQTRELDLQEAQINRQKAQLELLNFLWGNQAGRVDEFPWDAPEWETGLNLGENTFPRMSAPLNLEMHPKVRQLNAKMEVLEVDRRLARQQMLPRLDVNYYLLGDGWSFSPTPADPEAGNPNILTQNYKWGVNFSWPIFMRKGNGKMQLARIKREQNQLERDFVRRELLNKWESFRVQTEQVQAQITLFESAVANYQRLLDAEVEKFRLGESSIFLINSREQKLIDARTKLIQLFGKYFQAQAAMVWVAGDLPQ